MHSFFLNHSNQIFLKNNPFHLNFIFLIFILFPITLITGPALPDIFLSVIALYFLVISILKKEFSYYKNIFVYLFGLFAVYIIIRGLLSADPYSSLILYNGPLFYFRYLFFILGVWYLLEKNSNLIKYFTFIFILVIFFAISDFRVQPTGVWIKNTVK